MCYDKEKDLQISVYRSVMHRTPKAPSDEGSKATSNETIAGGNRTYDYVSAKLTGGEKTQVFATCFSPSAPSGHLPRQREARRSRAIASNR